jgi:uncharacterized protein (DUF1810 family)
MTILVRMLNIKRKLNTKAATVNLYLIGKRLIECLSSVPHVNSMSYYDIYLYHRGENKDLNLA